jgi:hypothetical protein
VQDEVQKEAGSGDVWLLAPNVPAAGEPRLVLMHKNREEKHCSVAWQPPDAHYQRANTVLLLGNRLMHIISEEQKHCSVACQPPDAYYQRANTVQLLGNRLMHIISEQTLFSCLATA